MFNRRQILGTAFAAGTVALTGAARAAGWRDKYPELVLGIIPAENASGVSDRYAPFVDYLSKELGTKVTLRVANDYAAVIEGQRNGSIHIAGYGPASYARAVVTGVKIEPFCTTVNDDGTVGYYSVFYVRTDSPYKTIEDLKGKNLGLVDPNSTSGNNVPRFILNKLKIKPEAYFAHVTYTGSHENAVIALQQKTVDVAANWWNSEDDSNLTRMVTKGLVKKEDFRIISKSDLIPNSPLRLSGRHAGRPQGRDLEGLPGSADEGQGRLRQAVGRQGPEFKTGRRQVLRRRRRADQVHRQPAQAEELAARPGGG